MNRRPAVQGICMSLRFGREYVIYIMERCALVRTCTWVPIWYSLKFWVRSRQQTTQGTRPLVSLYELSYRSIFVHVCSNARVLVLIHMIASSPKDENWATKRNSLRSCRCPTYSGAMLIVQIYYMTYARQRAKRISNAPALGYNRAIQWIG